MYFFRKLLQRKAVVSALKGLTLVELLISMVLLSFLMLSIANLTIGNTLLSSSLGDRFKEASEVQALISDIQADFYRGVYINPNSFRNRLEYTTYDPAAQSAVKKVYGICYYSSVQTAGTDTTCPLSGTGGTFVYLKLSTDGGATWGSPYRVSDFNKYRLSGTPKFLFSHPQNDCWDYMDTNGNGVWAYGEGATYVACSAGSDSNIVDTSKRPETSAKLILNGFTFTTGKGRPESIRSIQNYFFINASPGLVRSTLAAVSPGVKDTQLVQSFSTNPAVNPLFASGFILRGLSWDPDHEVLLLSSESTAQIIRTERNGVFIDVPFFLNNFNTTPDWLCMEGDGQTVMAVQLTGGGSSYTYYRFNLNRGNPLQPVTGPIVLAGLSAARGYAFDPNTPDHFYNISSTTSYRVERRDKYTGAVTGSTLNTDYWALPAAFSSTNHLSGLFVEQVTGNFYVIRNSIYTGGDGRKYVDVYKIVRSSGTATLDFSIDITDLGMTATAETGWLQAAYDPDLNRLFISSRADNRVYEVVPPKLISPRF